MKNLLIKAKLSERMNFNTLKRTQKLKPLAVLYFKKFPQSYASLLPLL